MANLIVAVMAIALASVLATVAFNYVGSLYTDGRADAQAAQLISDSAKVASALRSWSRVNGGSTTLSDTNWSNGAPTDLINGSNMYLDALPQLGSYAQGNGSTDYYIKTMPSSNIAWGNEGTNFNCLFAVITSVGVCKAIARLSRGDTATPLIISAGSTLTISSGTTGTNFSTVMANSDFDCVFNDVNNDGNIDSGDSMFFLYKVF